VRRRVLYPAIERANCLLEERGLPTISPDVTFHSLRRTYASLAAEAGVDPAWATAQIGHERAGFTLDVYTDVRNRRKSAADRVGGLVRASEWAPMGTSDDSDEPPPEEAAPDSDLQSP
jgi:integrase